MKREEAIALDYFKRGLMAAAGDVCMHCGRRAPQWDPKPEGPNEAGNWVHYLLGDLTKKRPEPCRASAVHQRLKAMEPRA